MGRKVICKWSYQTTTNHQITTAQSPSVLQHKVNMTIRCLGKSSLALFLKFSK